MEGLDWALNMWPGLASQRGGKRARGLRDALVVAEIPQLNLSNVSLFLSDPCRTERLLGTVRA